jgi:hypothetical protein
MRDDEHRNGMPSKGSSAQVREIPRDIDRERESDGELV